MKTEIAELDGKKLEIVTELPDDFYEEYDSYFNDINKTSDLSKEISVLNDLDNGDNYEQ